MAGKIKDKDDDLNLDVNTALKRRLILKGLLVVIIVIGGSASVIYTKFIAKNDKAKVESKQKLDLIDKYQDELEPVQGTGEEIKKETATPVDGKGKTGLLGQARYYNIEPAFIVKLLSEDGVKHYVQFEATLMTRDSKLFMQLKDHDPLIKSEIVRVTGSQYYEDLVTIEGRELFKEELLKQLKRKLKTVILNGKLDDILFTKFIME